MKHFLQADAVRLPFADDSVDLVIGSPPYADARTYGISAQRKCQVWIDWMIDVTAEAVRVSRGLVIWICAGVTRDWCYWPGPEGLLYEWWKRGGRCWRPAYWHRVGIPGSGGKQWLRADIEYALCFTSCRAAIPWADNTANGHPPKWAPGGEMSYRDSHGTRRNEWGATGHETGAQGRRPNGQHKTRQPVNGAKQITRRISQGHGPDGDTRQDDVYVPPVLANPGVLVDVPLHNLSIIDILDLYGQVTNNSDQVLRELRDAVASQGLRIWFARIYSRVLESSILQSCLQGDDAEASEWPETWWSASQGEKDSETEEGQERLRKMRPNDSLGSSPQGRERNQQRSRELGSSLPLVSSERAQNGTVLDPGVRQAILGSRLLLGSLPAIQEVWRSFCEAVESASSTSESANLIRGIRVGGGLMGHKCAHVNEAPYPQKLAEWFVRGWAPPGGLVLDPFSGSGTTVAAAVALGRRGVGCDLRWSQVELGAKRCAEVQGNLLG